MRIVICDDDKNIVESLHETIIDYFISRKLDPPKIDLFYSGDSLLEDTEKKDIVFLDIEMPGLNGLYTGKKLLEQNRSLILIIITSYTEYLDDAMRINVFRYISKPIDTARVKRNFCDAIGAYNERVKKNIIIKTDNGMVGIKSSDILMIEMKDRKAILYTVHGEVSTDKNMKEWMKILPNSQFYQSHRSYIVNISHIRKIQSDIIVMDRDGLVAYLTKRKNTEIKKLWSLYMESSN